MFKSFLVCVLVICLFFMAFHWVLCPAFPGFAARLPVEVFVSGHVYEWYDKGVENLA